MADETLAQEDVRVARIGGWWLLLLVGLLSIAVGITILFKPGDSLATLAVIVGIFVLIDGVLELAASHMHGTQNRGVVALLGALTAIVGVLLIRHPCRKVIVALLIGIWLIAVGVIRFVAAFDASDHGTENMIAGLVELIAGIVIVSNPNIGYATLAVLVGIGLPSVQPAWACPRSGGTCTPSDERAAAPCIMRLPLPVAALDKKRRMPWPPPAPTVEGRPRESVASIHGSPGVPGTSPLAPYHGDE